MSDLISKKELYRKLGEAYQKGYFSWGANEIIKDIIGECDSVENKGEWIPVSERLPEIHQNVLLSLRSLDVEVGFRAETEPYFYCHGADGCYIEPQNVLAWQPLPEPYKAESEET